MTNTFYNRIALGRSIAQLVQVYWIKKQQHKDLITNKLLITMILVLIAKIAVLIML